MDESLLKPWHILDYIIVRQRDMHNVIVMKAMCGADCWMDSRMIVSKLNIKISPSRQPWDTKASKQLNIARPKSNTVNQSLRAEMDSRLESLGLSSNDVEADWANFRDTMLLPQK